MRAICRVVSLWFDSGGGIRSSGSWVVIRRNNSLSALLPGMITDLPSLIRNTPSRVSSRSFPLRAFSSGPWHWKQLSDKIGRISRLKSTLPLPGARSTLAAAASELSEVTATRTNPARTTSSQAASIRLVAMDRELRILSPQLTQSIEHSHAFRSAFKRKHRSGAGRAHPEVVGNGAPRLQVGQRDLNDNRLLSRLQNAT